MMKITIFDTCAWLLLAGLFAGCSSHQEPTTPSDGTLVIPKANTAGQPIAAIVSPSFVAPVPNGFLTESLSLLSDRWAARFPAGARLEPMNPGIMGAEQSAETESRVVVEAQAEKMVVMVYELNAKAGADLSAGVGKDVAHSFGDPKPALKPIALAAPSAKAIAVLPQSHDLTREDIYVFGGYMAHPDGLVEYAAFYVNPAAANGTTDCAGLAKLAGAPEGLQPEPKTLTRCTALAQAVFSTLSPGARRIEIKGGEKKLAGQYGDDTIFITLPDDATSTVQAGPDFTVHHVSLVTVLGEPQPSLGIYVGGHPSFQHQQSMSGATVVKSPGTVLGKPVEWNTWRRDDGLLMSEAILAHPSSEQMQIHVFATAGDETALRGLVKLASTLRVQ